MHISPITLFFLSCLCKYFFKKLTLYLRIDSWSVWVYDMESCMLRKRVPQTPGCKVNQADWGTHWTNRLTKTFLELFLVVDHPEITLCLQRQRRQDWYHPEKNLGIIRSSRQEVLFKKGVLRNFVKFTWKHLC